MKQPLILITGGTGAAANGTPTWNLNQNYADNIVRAGGLPILAVNNDNAKAYAELADGLLLSGGKDVDPALYGQELKYDFVIMDKQRDDLEWKLVKAFIEKKKPIWGICRGIQVLNAYFGGTLYQDIPDQIGGDHAKGVCHPCTLKRIPSLESSSANPWRSTATIIRLLISWLPAWWLPPGPIPTDTRS